MLLHALSFGLALAFVPGPQLPGDEPGIVRGRIRSEATGRPLPFANVEIVLPGRTLNSESDHTGAYVIRDVPSGRRLLRAVHIDHAPLEVEVLVPPGGEVVLDLVLDLRPVVLPTVTARAAPGRPAPRDSAVEAVAELGVTAVRALEATPGMAELGLGQAWRSPGHEPIDPTDVLYVRGSATDLKLVLLDGAPVYAPFHLGGLINAFEPEMLQSANLQLGGAPARFDGGLSYILDMQTRPGRQDESHAMVAMDLLSARGVAEGPIGRTGSYLAGVRTVHGAGSGVFGRSNFPYSYADGLARIDVDQGDEGALSLTSFWNRESVALDSVTPAESRAQWGNTAVSLRYSGRLLGGEADFTAALGNYHADLPAGGVRPLLARGTSLRGRLAADFARWFGTARVGYGASFDRLRLHYRAWPEGSAGIRDSLLLDQATTGDAFGLYADGAWQPFGWLRLRGGLRADYFALGDDVRLAPRISATWLPIDRVALTLAAGRYHQYVRAPEPALAPEVEPVEDPAQVAPSPLSVASATHLALALDQDLGGGIRLGIEGFYKSFEGVPGTRAKLTQASGVDLWGRRNTGAITGWLGYSLAWVWSVEDRGDATELFAGRHLLSTGLAGPIGQDARFDIRLAYGAGLPFTAIPEPNVPAPPVGLAGAPGLESSFGTMARSLSDPTGAASVGPDEPYLRLDAGISRTWHPIWRGAEMAVTPYFRVLNALGRRDALFYVGGDQTLEPRPLAAIPLLPVFGVEARF